MLCHVALTLIVGDYFVSSSLLSQLLRAIDITGTTTVSDFAKVFIISELQK